jgi:hypothetical protein
MWSAILTGMFHGFRQSSNQIIKQATASSSHILAKIIVLNYPLHPTLYTLSS